MTVLSVGVLGQADLAAATYTTVYQIPDSTTRANFNVVFCNRSSSVASVRLAFSAASGTPVAAAFRVYDYIIEPNDPPFVLSGCLLANSEYIVAYSSVASVTCSVEGFTGAK